MAKSANTLMTLARHLEQDPRRSRLSRAHHLHLLLLLPHPELAREEAVTLYQEMSATFIGIPANVTGDLTAHSDTKKTQENKLEALILLTKEK